MGRHETFENAEPLSEADAPHELSSMQALRSRWRFALEAVNRGGRTDVEARRLGSQAAAAEQAVIAAPVRSIADLACKVEVLRAHFEGGSLDVGAPFAAVRAICDGIEELAGSAVPGAGPASSELASTAEPDPILAAIEAHRAAFAEANVQPTERLAEAAYHRWQRSYDGLKATTPTTAAGVCALAEHLRQFLKDGGNEIDNTFEGEAFTTLLNAIRRFRMAGAGVFAAHPEPHDLSGIDSGALAHLFDVYESVSSQWCAVSCQPCIEGGGIEKGSALAMALNEADRAGVARDRIADELRRRTPQDARERDALLSVRIKEELLCEGRIMDRELLMDAVKAWG